MHRRQREWRKGELVGHVDMDLLFGPLEVPIAPRAWCPLRIHPGKLTKVMRRYAERNVSAWVPTVYETREVDRRGNPTRQRVLVPLWHGIVIVPDFDFERALHFDHVFGPLRFGEFTPLLRPCDVQAIRNIVAIHNTPRSKRARKFAVGDLVRVVDGPFASFGARVERLDSGGRITADVDIFKRLTPVEFDEGQLEPA